MYESETYEVILARALERVSIDIDKREGSLIYNALAPACAELAQMYIELDQVINNISLDTAAGSYLTSLCYQHGISRKDAVKAQRKGAFNVEVPIGSRFRLEDTTYIVLSKIANNEYVLVCEQMGEDGNVYKGEMKAISYVADLTSAVLSDVIVYGSEEETDDSLRDRMRQYLTAPTQDGNTAQYIKWATDYEGIGAAKVFPLWNGGNTVRIAITNALYKPATETLVKEFQQYIDPGASGLGNGVAPIGSKVTVTGGTKKDINISASVVLAEGYTEATGAGDAISKYFASVTYNKNSISYMRIGSTLLDCHSISDIHNLTINGGTTDVALVGDEIPVLANLDLAVVST